MSTTERPVAIIGAGVAGGETAFRLRQGGFKGQIMLIGDEACAPYHRPPLSKAFLAGGTDRESLSIRPINAYTDAGIDVRVGNGAVAIDRKRKRIALQDGTEVAYGVLVLATGARPNVLSVSGDASKVNFLRTRLDAERLSEKIQPGARVVVIGGGFIGLEVAATASKSGAAVTVVEAAPRLLARVTSPEVAQFILEEHAVRGVKFICGIQPVAVSRHGVSLADGREIAADVVICGVGVAPNVEIAQACGLDVSDGVITDRYCRTSDPEVYAIGDCARRPLQRYPDYRRRLESVHNANEGARIVTAQLLGQSPPEEDVPWFWSDQYELKWQIAGLCGGYDQTVVRGAASDKAFAVFYFKQRRLIAVDAINRPADFLAAKQIIQRRLPVSADQVADPSRTMKEIMALA